MNRWGLIATLGLVFVGARTASAAELRTSLTPSAGLGVALSPKWHLHGQAEGRFVVQGPTFGSPAAIAIQVGPQWQVHPILGLFARYVGAWGVYPLEGLHDREHTARIGLQLASQGSRFIIGNVTSVGLRSLRDDGTWQFSARARTELRFTAIPHRYAKITLSSETLSPLDDRWARHLQMRIGLAVHGDHTFAKRTNSPRPPPAIYWLLSPRVGLSPVALARHDTSTTDRFETDRAHVIDLVIAGSVGGTF